VLGPSVPGPWVLSERALLTGIRVGDWLSAISSSDCHRWSASSSSPVPAYACSLDVLQDYSIVEEIQASMNSRCLPCDYWAALMSLTAEEGPAHGRWPSISPERQAELLTLFQREACRLRHHAKPTISSSSSSSSAAGLSGAESDLYAVLTSDLVTPRLREVFELNVDVEKLTTLVLVWKFNAFRNCSSLMQDMGHEQLDIFLVPSLCGHSCAPNCHWKFDADSNSFQLYSSADVVSTGDELTISYLSDTDLQVLDVHERRNIIARNWLLFCRCLRCSQTPVPSCPWCSGGEMTVVISLAEEELYEGLDVMCDLCEQENLQWKYGYFFHCEACGQDLCHQCDQASWTSRFSESHSLWADAPQAPIAS